jgi:crotonobetainyl-CoA:carnitine CoA-transferase CaiB-like acyl-CoA transferase
LARPLEGFRILDLTRMLAGPYGTLLLADLGAEIVKIEDPAGGDPTRRIPPHYAEPDESAYFLAANRAKKSVALDVRDPDGRAAFDKLVATCDAVVDNFRPGARERLGLTPERLRASNPDLVICSLSSFGSDVEDRDVPTFDLVLQALGGGLSITGEPGRAPVRAGIPIGDLAGGMFMATSVCAQLLQRERTKQPPAPTDISLLDCQAHLLTYVAQTYWLTGNVPQRIGSGHTGVVPYHAFATADGWIVVAIFVERFWAGLCEALGIPEVATDERFASNAQRVVHRDEVMPLLETAIYAKPTAHWIGVLREAGVPAAPVHTVDQVVQDPRLTQRDLVTEVDHPTVGTIPALGGAFRTQPPEAADRTSAPVLGQHTRAVLKSCGVGDDALDALVAKGAAVVWEPQ